MLAGLWTPEGTLLHLATRLGRPDVVRALLYAGADPGVQNQDGDTPVHLSASDTMRSVYTDELFKATAQSKLVASKNFAQGCYFFSLMNLVVGL